MAKATKFIQLMQETTGWKQSGSAIIGQKEDYWFTISQTALYQPILISASVAGLQSISLEQLKIAVLAKKKIYKLARFENKNNVLNFVINSDTNAQKNMERVNELLHDLTSLLAQLGLANGCKLCASDVPVDAVRIGADVAGVCAECQEKLKQEFTGNVEKNAFEGNYFTGIIGALLGSLVGAALWLLVSYLGFYASIVGFVMAFLAQYGYRLFKGRIQRGMPVIILLAVIFGLMAANTVEIAIGLAQDPEVGLTFVESLRIAPQAFYNTEYFYVDKVWGNVGLGLLFAFLGSWRTIKNLSEETKGTIYQIEQI
jgi:hypothetical protein